MVNLELKEDAPHDWTIITDQGVELGRRRHQSVNKAKYWCSVYLSSWSENFNITVIYDGKSYPFNDDIET